MYVCNVQVVLGPLVVGAIFTYSMLLEGRPRDIPQKLTRDMWPTLLNGWKFWIPAASVNFAVVPLQHQVLYMSTCGVVWNAMLSAASK